MVNWKNTQQVYSSSWNQVHSPSKNQSVFGRNLTEEQLGGVIFGCKNATMKECLTKQLFGLPAAHFSYVKYVRPGMPLFLFNYSDRTLHGIFEAAGTGRMFIDNHAWTADGSQVTLTQFPAQVQTRVQLQCRPLSEDMFKHVIADNYYHHNKFWFELDHGQTSRLIALLKPLAIAPANSVPQNTNRPTVSRCLPCRDPSLKAKTFKMPEPELEEHHSEEKEASPNSPFEEENSSSPLEHQYNIAQLVQKLKELSCFQKTEAERTNYVEQKLIEAELEIQLLKDRVTLLESTHDTQLTRDTPTPSLIL